MIPTIIAAAAGAVVGGLSVWLWGHLVRSNRQRVLDEYTLPHDFGGDL